MASVITGALPLLSLLLLLLPLPSTPTTLYVTPSPHTPCPSYPCHTLSQYVENGTEYFVSNTTMIFLLGEHILQTLANITNITGFSMVGESAGTSRIVCNGSECGGFYFENVSLSRRGITNLSFVSDSQSITAVYTDNLQLVNCTFANSSKTALITYKSILLLDGNTFVNNSGGTANQMSLIPGGGITAVFSNVTFQGQNTFLNNTCTADLCGGGAMFSENSNIVVKGNVSFINNMATGLHGSGGMHLQNSNMDIAGAVSLINNSAADFGGGISLSNSAVRISGTMSLTDNYAAIQSGGMALQSSNMSISGTMSLTDNYAGYQSGGISVYDSSVQIAGSVSVTNNNAGIAGGGMSVYGSEITITGAMSLINNSAGAFGGGINMLSSNMIVAGNVSLTGYYGVALYGSVINISGTVSLTDNYAGIAGGGMSLDGDSQLDIAGKVHFVENHAVSGGAIHVQDVSPLVYCASDVGAACVIEDCFFQINENVSLNRDKLLVFEGNVAKAGSVLYGGAIDRCRLEGQPEAHSGEVFDMIANYSKQPDTLSVISSHPFRVCLCKNNRPNCRDTGNFTAYPGETIPITVAAVGQRNGTVTAVINAFTNPSATSRLGSFEERQIAFAACSKLHYTFFSRNSINQLIMYVDGSCSSVDGSVNRLTIPVHLLPCPPAFTLSESNYGCVCEERLQKYTNKCNINDQTIHRDGDFWVGYDNQSHGLILHPHCPFDYCKSKSIHFTLNEIDLQCENNRTGLLCGACQPGLSLALGSSRCLSCSHDAYLSLLLPFALMGLVLVLFLLVCGLTVAVGTISGLIFYANIVGANQSLFFPPGSMNPLAVFIAWLNLDLGIETCFYDGMDAYVKIWLQFAFPMYMWALVGLIIFFSKHSRRISRMLGRNPVAVLATLILLSYTKILRTIIAALSFTTLQYPNDETRSVWLYDANIWFLNGKHIPLFVAGLLFFVFLFLPYTLLLLLGQWLQKFSHLKILSWMNNQKFKAFLHAYYAPYERKCRYWTGLLLALRFVLLVYGANILDDDSENLLVISAASFGLVVSMVGKVYEKWYLNVLEASYILNLGILAAATYHVQQLGGNQAAITYTSTGIAFATFIVIVLCHIYLQTKRSRIWGVLRNRKEQESEWDEIVDSREKPLTAPSSSYGSVQYREPLLDSQ